MIDKNALRQAIEATDGYLGVEKRILAGDKSDKALHDFTYHFSRAHDILDALGDQQNHADYMQNHVNTVLKGLDHHDSNLGDEPFTHVPRSDQGQDVSESFLEEDKKKKSHSETLTMMANALRWDHIADTYNKSQIDEAKDSSMKDEDDPCWAGYKMVGTKKKNGKTVPNCVPIGSKKAAQITEKLSHSARLKKSQSMSRRKSSLALSRNIKLNRSSTPQELSRRAVVAARRIMMQKMLHGRDKSSLSNSEKEIIEQRLSQMKNMQTQLAVRLIPKIKSLERKRLSSSAKKKVEK